MSIKTFQQLSFDTTKYGNLEVSSSLTTHDNKFTTFLTIGTIRIQASKDIKLLKKEPNHNMWICCDAWFGQPLHHSMPNLASTDTIQSPFASQKLLEITKSKCITNQIADPASLEIQNHEIKENEEDGDYDSWRLEDAEELSILK